MAHTKSTEPITPIEGLRKLYFDGNLSTNEVAKRIGRSPTTVAGRLRKAGFVLRTLQESSQLSYDTGYRRFLSLANRGLTDEVIKKLYLEEKLSVPEIANKFGCSASGIDTRLRKMDCMRNLSEANKIAYKKYPKQSFTHFKGGKYTDKAGYILVLAPNHPRGGKGRYVFEHILVWEHCHNKSVPKGYIIHHLNGIKSDNRPENLVAMPRAKHTALLEPYKKHIRKLEIENRQLRKALENSQMMFHISEN